MGLAFESPGGEAWESRTVSLSEPPYEDNDIESVLHCAETAADDMASLPSLEEIQGARDASRLANEKSLKHQIDLHLRKQTGLMMKRVKAGGGDMRLASAVLQDARKAFSRKLDDGMLHSLP